MKLKNRLLIFIFSSSLLTLVSNRSALSDEINTYLIISDSQSQTNEGNFEALGDVIIQDQKNFNARSNKLIYDKDKSIKLIGNVKIDNYQYEDIFIENIEGDEFILFTDKGGFQINSKNKNRVKTRLKFLN